MSVRRRRRASAPTASSPSTTTSASAAPIATSPVPIRRASRSPRRTSPMATSAMQNEIEREDPARLGVAQKCTFCSDRIDFGIENGMTPGSDPRATPACVNACIADALHFGDLDDPGQQRLAPAARAQEFPHACRARHRARLLLSLRQGRRAAPAPDVAAGARRTRKPDALRTRGVEPWHQKHWDWKASAQFPLRRRRRRTCSASPRSPASPARRCCCRASPRSPSSRSA